MSLVFPVKVRFLPLRFGGGYRQGSLVRNVIPWKSLDRHTLPTSRGATQSAKAQLSLCSFLSRGRSFCCGDPLSKATLALWQGSTSPSWGTTERSWISYGREVPSELFALSFSHHSGKPGILNYPHHPASPLH